MRAQSRKVCASVRLFDGRVPNVPRGTQQRHWHGGDGHNVNGDHRRVGYDGQQSLKGAVDRIDDSLKLFGLLLTRLRRGASRREPRRKEQGPGYREVPEYPTQFAHAITPFVNAL